jgi:hypothetical protein
MARRRRRSGRDARASWRARGGVCGGAVRK